MLAIPGEIQESFYAFRLLLNGKRIGVLTFAARRLSLAVFYGVLCSSTGFAADPSSFEAIFELTASQLEINEGDVVEFDIVNKSYMNSSTGSVFNIEADMSAVEWDWGGGEEGANDKAFGLYNIKHRFWQDSEKARLIKATHQNTTKQVSITVNNVAPEVHSVSVTKPAVKGKPLVFQAGARDPGQLDELEYTWDFGDGGTDTGMAVTHTYASDGIYEVELDVSDGKDTSGIIFQVNVGEVPFTPGMLDVDGDITVSEAEIDGVILVGSTANPTHPEAGGVCQLRLEMRSAKYKTGFTLTALLDPGLAPGHYNIGKTSEWDGQHKNDASALGTFFASYQAPKNQARRNFGGRSVGGPFWSDYGQVTITKFDGETLELNFEAFLTEHIPEEYFPREVRVVGGLSTSVPSAAAGPDIDNVTENSGIGPELSNEEFIGGLLDLGQGGMSVKTYLCGGEEPAEFELVSSFPAANATNADYVNTGIKAMFTQAVDPDSLMDNAFVKFRGTDGTALELPGSWVVSPKSRKMIQFVPQATLLPGLVHCVQFDAGTEGIRSMGGNQLTGSSLAGFSQAMAPACNYADATDDIADTRRFAFSTQVELTSLWVDFYQGSLGGGGVKLVRGKQMAARVYPYWRSRFGNVHPAAQVTEFSARVHITRDRKAFFPEQSTIIKRPDLFTNDERRRKKNSVNFTGWLPSSSKGITSEASAFAVVVPLSNNDALLRTVYPGAISELNLWADRMDFELVTVYAQGACAAEVAAEDCGWNESFAPYYTTELVETEGIALNFASLNMPVYSMVHVEEDLDMDLAPCSEEGYGSEVGLPVDMCIHNNIVTIWPGEGGVEPAADVARRLAHVAKNHSWLPGPVHATLVFVAPGLLPDPDNEPIKIYLFDYPLAPVVLAQVDRLDEFELAYYIVWSVLKNNGCHHYRPDTCPPAGDDHPWTVQGLRFKYTEEVSPLIFNKHHAEGNEEDDRLIPLLRYGPGDERNLRNTFISAYNFKKLSDHIVNRNRIWREDNPD